LKANLSFQRMAKAGLLKKIRDIFNSDRLNHGVPYIRPR